MCACVCGSSAGVPARPECRHLPLGSTTQLPRTPSPARCTWRLRPGTHPLGIRCHRGRALLPPRGIPPPLPPRRSRPGRRWRPPGTLATPGAKFLARWRWRSERGERASSGHTQTCGDLTHLDNDPDVQVGSQCEPSLASPARRPTPRSRKKFPHLHKRGRAVRMGTGAYIIHTGSNGGVGVTCMVIIWRLSPRKIIGVAQ